MSKIKFFRELEANLPANNVAHAGKIYFTNERNIYVYDSSGNRQKMTEVIFMADEAAITAIGSPLPNKVYVAITEATMWFWRTSNSTWQKLGGSSAVAALNDLTDVDLSSPTNGQALIFNGTNWVNQALPAGSGDVVGPASATNERLAVFDGTTGKLLKQGGYTEAGLRSRSNHTGTQLAATISDFAATVRATVLTGLSTATNAAIAAADSILVAIGKLQAQINNLISVKISRTENDASGFGFVDNDGDLTANENTLLPTQKAVKAYVDGKVISADVFDAVKGATPIPDDHTAFANTDDLWTILNRLYGYNIDVEAQVDTRLPKAPDIAIHSGSTFTLAGNSNKYVYFTNAGGCVVDVSNVVGLQCMLINLGAGDITFNVVDDAVMDEPAIKISGANKAAFLQIRTGGLVGVYGATS